jgi:hypothetical protein
VALLVALPGSATADTLSHQQYLQRLQAARAQLAAARGTVVLLRTAQVAEARALLQRTTAVIAPAVVTPADGAVSVDDRALAEGVDTSDASLDSALARLDARIVLVSRVATPPILPSVADARLRDIVQQGAAASAPADLFDAIGRAVLRFLSELRGNSPDFGLLWPALGGAGLAVILFILATLGRALPERVRREVFVAGTAEHERADPAIHLRAADAALAAGRSRDALHALYLYVIAALATREAIRYDPALTDRELLVRAAAIPHADSLRDLVAIHERSWFGVRDPSVAEARRGRELALRVAP